jgi:F-type H+-transporting ATPase subunit a
MMGIEHELTHVALALFATAVIVVLSFVARFALGTGEAAVLPASKFSLKGIFEAVVDFMLALCNMLFGEAADTKLYVPLFGAVFIYIFVSNVIGLFPGFGASTQNINTGLAVGLFSFVVYHYLGVKEHGWAYLKHFLGPVVFLAPLMFVIEMISHLIRPLTLGLRLSANMTGDHTVLSIFLDLAPWGVPVVFYALGLFVCFMQAFIFTFLSMIYVMLAISHDH